MPAVPTGRVKAMVSPPRVAGAVTLLVFGILCGVPPSDAGVSQDQLGFNASQLLLLDAIERRLDNVKASIDVGWKLVAAAFVFLMQAGFSFCEAGGVRAGNVQSIVFKNLSDACIVALCWWATGHAFAFGSSSELIGSASFFLGADKALAARQLSVLAIGMVQAMTATTIVSGAVAERMPLRSYCLVVAFIASFLYPTVVHWVWSSGGWLAAYNPDAIGGNGCLDFGGSVVIHLTGGFAALVAAALVGPRKLPGGVDVFSEEGRKVTSSHNKFSVAIGTLLLWAGWYALNAVGNPIGEPTDRLPAIGLCGVTTSLGAAASAVTGLAISRVFLGYADLMLVCNCLLSGLVATSAGCAYMAPQYAVATGAAAAWVFYGAHRLRLRLRIDDVIDAWAVHGANGLWGGVAVGLWADDERIRAAGVVHRSDGGIVGGGDGSQLGVQLLAVSAVMVWSAVLTALVCLFLRSMPALGLRVAEEIELQGVDIAAHRGGAYDYLATLEAAKFGDVASEVTAELVAFHLDEAEALVERARANGERWTPLLDAFADLISNLRGYRPFLPDTLFGRGSDSDDDHNADGDGAGSSPPTPQLQQQQNGDVLATPGLQKDEDARTLPSVASQELRQPGSFHLSPTDAPLMQVRVLHESSAGRRRSSAAERAAAAVSAGTGSKRGSQQSKEAATPTQKSLDPMTRTGSRRKGRTAMQRLDRGMRSAVVTVLDFELRSALTPDTVQADMSRLCGVLDVVHTNKGSIERLGALRVLVSWNAVHRCAGAKSLAVQCSHMLHQRIGVGTAHSCVCAAHAVSGNVGSDCARSHLIVAPALTRHRRLLLPLARHLNVATMCDSEIVSRVCFDYDCRPLDVLHAPGLDMVAFEVRAPTGKQEDQGAEWMYAIQGREDICSPRSVRRVSAHVDPFLQAFDALCDGDLTNALELFQQCEERLLRLGGKADPQLLRLQKLCGSLQPGVPYRREAHVLPFLNVYGDEIAAAPDVPTPLPPPPPPPPPPPDRRSTVDPLSTTTGTSASSNHSDELQHSRRKSGASTRSSSCASSSRASFHGPLPGTGRTRKKGDSLTSPIAAGRPQLPPLQHRGTLPRSDTPPGV
eukprot:TRINITY_DN5563_c0_g3_i1.p1 TRINITY_DN5563_c0_g3~~TRINITY_DN5563_c0_g3_i1.p1  ORF type:complete len:1097 (+),score=224.14 TRINITY_DN5563_c0_g3_i1:1629-4919(+)